MGIDNPRIEVRASLYQAIEARQFLGHDDVFNLHNKSISLLEAGKFVARLAKDDVPYYRPTMLEIAILQHPYLNTLDVI